MSEQFVPIGAADDIAPGTMKRFEIDGHPVLVANIGGRYWAVDDTCTHEEASLAGGALKGEIVKCPLHGARFNIMTGKVLEEPAERDLRTYRVKVDGGALLIERG